ncbi:hypothetical protein ACQY0O_005713 [Thecaphora frezii]
MPSEIDDIFSGKPVASSSSSATTTTAAAAGTASSTKKSKKRKPTSSSSLSEPIPSSSSSSTHPSREGKTHTEEGPAKKKKKTDKPSKPKKEVEVMHDPSATIEDQATKQASAKSKSAGKRHSRQAATLQGYDPEKQKELEEFMDSRGSSRKRTEDGLPIYSEAELRIGEGGDTPLCPFDCDCCF